jgi:hypothetical protein
MYEMSVANKQSSKTAKNIKYKGFSSSHISLRHIINSFQIFRPNCCYKNIIVLQLDCARNNNLLNNFKFKIFSSFNFNLLRHRAFGSGWSSTYHLNARRKLGDRLQWLSFRRRNEFSA